MPSITVKSNTPYLVRYISPTDMAVHPGIGVRHTSDVWTVVITDGPTPRTYVTRDDDIIIDDLLIPAKSLWKTSDDNCRGHDPRYIQVGSHWLLPVTLGRATVVHVVRRTTHGWQPTDHLANIRMNWISDTEAEQPLCPAPEITVDPKAHDPKVGSRWVVQFPVEFRDRTTAVSTPIVMGVAEKTTDGWLMSVAEKTTDGWLMSRPLVEDLRGKTRVAQPVLNHTDPSIRPVIELSC